MAHGDFFFAHKNTKTENRNNFVTTLHSETSNNISNNYKVDTQPPPPPIPLHDIVPLYGCEMPKSQVVADANIRGRLQGTLGPEVNRRKPSSIKLKDTSSLTTSYTSTSSGVQIGANGGLNANKSERKSYVDLHYAKIGYPYVKGGRMVKGKDVMDTVRGVCGTERSGSNESLPNISEDTELFEDAQSCLSDTTSFYENFMEKEMILNLAEDDFSDLKSVSQVSTQKNPSIRSSGKKTSSVMSVPVLASLGPDPLATKEKMDNLKKKQIYGQKASEQNRIKIMEKKILLGLKSELRKSIYVDKHYLSKYIEDC